MENLIVNYRLELLNSIKQKDVLQIGKHIRQAEEQGFDSFEWQKYMIEIFAMLTDSTIQMPTFTRRKVIFDAFKASINIRLNMREDNEDLKKNIQYFIRVIMSIVDGLHQQADQQTKKLFSNLVIKILVTCSGFKEQEHSSLIELKTKILKSVYPFPANYKIGKKEVKKLINDQDRSNNQASNLSIPDQDDQTKNIVATEFIYRDLVLWYEMGLELKNFLEQDCVSFQNCWNRLNELRAKVQDLRQPNLKVIYLYNILHEAIKILALYDDVDQIKMAALNVVNKLISQVKYKLVQYYETTNPRSKQTCHNLFLTTLRFNIFVPCYIIITMVQNDEKSSPLMYLKEVRDVLAIIFLPLCERKKKQSNLNKQIALFEKIYKFELQLKIIDFDLKMLQQKFFNEKMHKTNLKQSIKGSKFWSLIAYNLENSHSLPQTDYQKLFQQELVNLRSSSQAKTSEIIQMSKLVPLVVKLLHSNFQYFTLIMQRLLSPVLILKVCTSLLTQFHFRQENLIQFCIEMARTVIIIYFDNPEIIQSQYEVQNITNAVNVLKLSKNQPDLHYCSCCGKFQLAQFCANCGQICWKAYKSDPNFEEIWHEFIQNWQFFKKNERVRLKERIGSSLIETLTFACNN